MHTRMRRLGAGALPAIALVATLALAGCGGAGASTAGGSSSAPPSHPGSGLTIRPCTASYNPGGSPAVVLGGSSASRSASVKQGDMVEVRLDTAHKWQLDQKSLGSVLSAVNTEGASDGAACVWDFKAQAPGATKVTFSGTPLCDPTQQCPQYVMALTFDITVS